MKILHVDFTVDTGTEFSDVQALKMLKSMLDMFNKKLPPQMQLKYIGEETVKLNMEDVKKAE